MILVLLKIKSKVWLILNRTILTYKLKEHDFVADVIFNRYTGVCLK